MTTRWLKVMAFVAMATFVMPVAALHAQEEEEAGNNLSVPVIWSDGATKTLPGTFGAPVFDGEFYTLDGVRYYLQQDPLNRWQAESLSGLGALVDVSWIDWGDNLEARSWYENSVVRVETTLYQDLVTPMLGFEMAFLWGEGTTEMWGTSRNTFDAVQATVYSGVARLTIQKLQKPPGSASLTWDPVNGQWTGDVNAPVFNHGVWETGTGKPTSRYSGEINIPGKVVYGYNWNLRLTGEGAGYYRITFSLADNAPVPRNTAFTTTQILVSEEEVVEAVDAEAEAEPAGGVAAIDRANNLTYIDVQILPAKGRKGGSGGQKISDTTLTTDKVAPQVAGTTITVSASASGGVGKRQYKFWVSDSVGVWEVAQDWSTDDTLEWTPATASPESRVGVWVRSSDSSLDAPETDEAWASIEFPITPLEPLAVVVTASKEAPQPVGSGTQFTAAATGGTGDYEYLWWIFDGTRWKIAVDWSSSEAIVWTPSVPSANARVGVWVRSIGGTTISYSFISFAISAAP